MLSFRRGHIFEHELDKIVNYLNSIGVHAHKNHAKRTTDGTYIEGEPFDYEVFSGGRLFCFDAKECHGKRWSLNNARLTQVKHLMNCKENGADAFFLVLFAPRTIRKFDVNIVHTALMNGQKSLGPGEGSDWDWTELQTLKQE